MDPDRKHVLFWFNQVNTILVRDNVIVTDRYVYERKTSLQTTCVVA